MISQVKFDLAKSWRDQGFVVSPPPQRLFRGGLLGHGSVWTAQGRDYKQVRSFAVGRAHATKARWPADLLALDAPP